MEKTDVPVPKAYALCQDDQVIGSDFYIMEFLDGRIFEDPAIPEVTPEERTKMWVAPPNIHWHVLKSTRWHSAITTLAKFHRVNPKDVNLAT